MDSNHLLGYFLAVLIGISLGLIGSGGSILSVPILVYVMGIEPILATAYSLFTVGITALVGGIKKANEKLVDFKKVIVFGLPTIISVFLTRKFIVPNLPDAIAITSTFSMSKSVLIMSIFAIVMMIAAVRMILPVKETELSDETNINYTKIGFTGIFIGLIAGFVGAGGGFLIIPALLFLAKTPMKVAIGTSLFIIAIQSLIGFLGDIRPEQILDWKLLITFSSCSIVGLFIGSALSQKMDASKLKTLFGWFVLFMGIYIIVKEVFI
jgi:uncharacterized protein